MLLLLILSVVVTHLEAGDDLGQAVTAALLGPTLGRIAQAHLLQPSQAVRQLACRHRWNELRCRPTPAPPLLLQRSSYGGQNVNGGAYMTGASLSLKVAEALCPDVQP